MALFLLCRIYAVCLIKFRFFMEETKDTSRVQVYNLVILDKSGSMGCIASAAIDGFNETLAGIKKAQERYAETQDHFVSLIAFCSCETTHIFDKVPVKEARPITAKDYQPCCCTPLYDAMGFSLMAMRKHVDKIENSMVVVTIITDGYENDSHVYNRQKVMELVESLKGNGWTFTYMGANQDSFKVGAGLGIGNNRDYEYNSEGMREAMTSDSRTRGKLFASMHAFSVSCDAYSATPEVLRRRYSELADEAFEEESRNRKSDK